MGSNTTMSPSESVEEKKQDILNDKDDEASLASERRLLWKIDLLLMPILTITYGLQYYDKALLSSAAVFGILDDLNLRVVVSENPLTYSTERYSWATSIFYFGYMAGALPMSFLAQRLPLAKFLAASVALWGIIVILTPVCYTWQALFVQRFFLGFVESSVSPGFVFVTSSWYRREEQAVRIGIWYSATGIFSSVVNYGLGKASDALVPWKTMYIFGGALTIFWGLVLGVFLPDSPLSAKWFFTRPEKKLAVSRVRENLTTVSIHRFNMRQLKEAVTDVQVALHFLTGVAIYICNGGLTAFGAIIIKSFGYSSYRTLLLLTPVGAATVVAIYISTFIARKVPNTRCLLMAVTCLPVIAGAVMIWKSDWEAGTAVPLAGFYLIGVFGAPYVMLVSLSAGCTAGRTKQSFAYGSLFVAYCAANIIAPQLVWA